MDPSITEIMVNGPQRVFIEQRGLLKRTPVKFENSSDLLKIALEIAKNMGKRLDKNHPCLDGRLPDGSRVNIVIPPVAVDGISITIRKFSPFVLDHEQLIKSGMFDERMAYFLSCCVEARLNIVVGGGTGSGKTTLLNVLSSFIPKHERVVTIEDAAELKIKSENLVRLESRPAQDNEGGTSIRQLVINALRMRPDRILVGECRGAEVLDMLVAMNTGHEGSMTTVHANSARESLRRLESMLLLSGVELPPRVSREHISSALDLVVNIQRQADGSRKVVEIMEVGGMEGEVILTQDIFAYEPSKGFHALGFVPRFVERFKERGLQFPPDFFTDRYNVRTIRKVPKGASASAKKRDIIKK